LAKVPFGLTRGEELDGEGKPVKNSTKPIKYSLDFNVDGTPQLDEFKQVMKKLDVKNIDHIFNKSQEWWGKKFTLDTITDACYGSVVKADKKGEYPDRFKIKLPFYDGLPRFKVYDENNKLINWATAEEGKPAVLDWSWAQPHMQIEAIIECEGLWEVNKKVFCTFKALQIRVRPPETLPECAFEEESVPYAVKVDVKEDAKEATKESTKDDEDLKVEDSEEEEEEDEQ